MAIETIELIDILKEIQEKNAETGDKSLGLSNNNLASIKSDSILSRLDNLEISQGKNKGTFANPTLLPSATNGDYAFVISTTSTWIYNNTWVDTEQDLKDNSLNKNNNLSELTDKAIARTNLDVYSKNEIDTSLDLKADKTTTYTKTDTNTLLLNKVDKITGKGLSTNDFDNNYKGQLDNLSENIEDAMAVVLTDTTTIDFIHDDENNKIEAKIKDNSISNTHILSNADIETSKIKQTTITPLNSIFTNNDTQDTLNNKTQGQLNNLQDIINTRPIGASNGSIYYLTSQDSIIANYELLSFSPDPSVLDVESITINASTTKENRLIHSYISNYEIGSAIINGGIWIFNFYGYVSHLNNSRFEIDVLKRVGTVETLLFTAETTKFLQTTQVSPDLNIVNAEITQQDFVCNNTDKIVIKVYAKTDRTQNTTITLLHSGTDYASHIHTPLIVSHDNIVGAKGGDIIDGRWHLSQTEYNKVQNLDTILDLKQNKTDNTLNTVDKTIVGAINENKANIELKANQLTTYTKVETNNLLDQKLNTSLKGQANGLTELDSDTKVKATQLRPSSVSYNAINGILSFTWADNSTSTIDLPLELVFQSAQFNDVTKILTFTLTSGATTQIDLSSLVDIAEIQISNQNPVAQPTTGQKLYFNTTSKEVFVNENSTWLGDKFYISNAEKTKLAGIEAQATKNSTDAQLRDRSTHTGMQLANTISDFQAQVSANVDLLNKEDVIATQTFLRYVSASGNDLTGKGTISKPYATYSKTLTGAQFPLTIFQSGQTITENLTLSSSQSNFNIKGYTSSRSRNNNVLSGAITTGANFTRLGIENLQLNSGTSSCVTFASGDLGGHTFENVDFVSTNANSIVFPTNYSNWCNFYNCDFSSCLGYINLPNLSSGNAILRLYDCGFVSISIGNGWTVYTNGDTQLNIVSKGSSALHIDLKTIRINSIISNQTTLNAIIGMASGGDGAYIVNFASPTGITGIQQGDIIWKVGSVQGILYKFIDAPSSVIVWASASTQQTYNKDVSLYWASPVSTITITDNSITNAKLSQVATQTFKGRNTTGVGNVEDLSILTTRAMLSINNIDNTSDLSKPISTATQTALNTKENTIIAGTTTQYYRGDKTFQSLDKVAVGLANVDNTADISKNVLSATKLTTVRTINGVSFDGTANITITDSTKVDKTQTIAGTALSGNITQDQITGLSATGIIKRTGANTLATAVAGTDYESPITTLSIAKGGTNSSTALTGNKVIVSNGTQIIESSISTTNLNSLDTTTSITSQLSSKEPAFTKNTAFNKNFGNTAGTVCQGNDARLGTKDIDETNIANGKIQVYNSTSGKLEYQTPSNGTTNLSIANKTSTTLDILSDTGTDATVPQATITEAGLLSATDKVKLNNTSGINSGDESSTTIYDKFSAQFVAGTNISIDKNNTAKTLTFNSTAIGGHAIEDYTITSFPNRSKLRFMGGGDTTVYAEDDIANNRTNVWISSTSSGGGTTWPIETTITTNTTLSANGSYLIDLTSNSITATLPSNPSNNTIIWLKVKKYINANTFTINLNTVNKKYDYYYSDNTALAIDTISGDGLLQITNSDANVYYDDFTLRYKTDKWIITNKTLIS